MTRKKGLTIALAFGCLAGLAALAPPAEAANIVLNVVDPPGVGFNDPTVVAPVGGNPHTTLGAQRQFVFETAALIWVAVLGSNVDIVIQSSFRPLACSPASRVLGAAGTIQIFANFGGADWPNTWHHSALANHLAGVDLTPGPFDPGLLQPPFNDDIVAFFNGDIGVNPNCLTGLTWYNGVDNNAPGNAFDLLNVVLHEFGHGLGFANFISDATGDLAFGIADIYSVFSRDDTSGLHMNQMDRRQRRDAAVNTGNLVWDGPHVFAAVPGFLAGTPVVRVNAPPGIAGDYQAQTASYGLSLLPPPGATGDVVLYNDGVGPDPNDACNCPFVPPCLSFAPLDNSVASKIALINRGACNFSLKSALAQLSGAVGVVITNHLATGLPPMGGSDVIAPTISSVGISKADGDLIKANLPGVNASLTADPALGFAGADANGFVKLFAPDPVQPGSSVSHWDTTLTPNALMEPFINSDLTHSVRSPQDLTLELLRDIGW